MGYGIYVTGTFQTDQPNGNAAKNHLLAAIREAIESELTDPLQRCLATLDETENELKLHLHPAAEDVEISVKDGSVDISAKTSTAGPGYHAMLVELLEKVAARAGIGLSWDDLEVGSDYEAGYHKNRDLELLRKETVRWLKTISRHITSEGDDARNILVNMPVDDRPFGETLVLAPMGEFSRDWLRSVCSADYINAAAMAEGFFPAWYSPEHAEYWANIGRYLILWDLDWTVPINDAERALYEAMLACYDRAIQLDSSIMVPDQEIREARKLLEGGDQAAPPRPDGLGYRRGVLDRSLNFGWSAKIPGYFRREHEIDGDRENTYFWFGDREIHYTVLSFDAIDEGTTAAEFVLRNTAPKGGETRLKFALRRDWITAQATSKAPNTHCTVQAMFGVTWKTEHRILVLTIVHEDTKDGQDWTTELLESVSHPEPKTD